MAMFERTRSNSAMVHTSPIKRSASDIEGSTYTSRPGKISRLNLSGRCSKNMSSVSPNYSMSSSSSFNIPTNKSYRSTLQLSTGSRMQFRLSQSPVTVGLPSPTGSDQSRGTPPREPKLLGEPLQQHFHQQNNFAYKMSIQPFDPSISNPSSNAYQQPLQNISERPNNFGFKGLHAFQRTRDTSTTNSNTCSHGSSIGNSSLQQQKKISPQQQESQQIYHMDASGISPVLKALKFSPALRPRSPPSLSIPTLQQLDDNAMISETPRADNSMMDDMGDDFDSGDEDENMLYQQQQQYYQSTINQNREIHSPMIPTQSMEGARSTSRASTSSSNSFPSFNHNHQFGSNNNGNQLLQQVFRPPTMFRSQSYESTLNPRARSRCGSTGSDLSSISSRPGTPLKYGSSILWNFRQNSPTRSSSRISNQSILLTGGQSGKQRVEDSCWPTQSVHISPVLTATFAATPTPSETSSIAVSILNENVSTS